MNVGIAICGPMKGLIVSYEGVRLDVHESDGVKHGRGAHVGGPNIQTADACDHHLSTYRWHTMCVADNETHATSDRHGFWVAHDEKGPNKAVMVYLLEAHKRMTGLSQLARRAHVVVGELMSGIGHTHGVDFAELNDVDTALYAEIPTETFRYTKEDN